MKVYARKSFLYGILALLGAVGWLVHTLGVLPAYANDLMLRAAPVLLVIVGVGWLLRGRVPLSGLIALGVGAGLLGGVGSTAFNVRQQQQRNDNEIVALQDVAANVVLLRVRLVALETDVEIVPAPSSQGRTLRVTYTGSTERDLASTYVEAADGSATFTLDEYATQPIPMLEAVGRGAMLVELPANLPVDVQLVTRSGDVNLSLTNVPLERLNLELQNGDALITLPAYAPQFSRPDDNLGALAVLNGEMLLRVPRDVSARLDMSESTGGNPTYDPAVYNLLFGRDILEARNIDGAEIIQRYDLFVNRDRLTVDIP